jgi:hypothetical protein
MTPSPVTYENLVHVVSMKKREIVSYLRTKRKKSEAQQDLTQQFFVHLGSRTHKLSHVVCLKSYVNEMAHNLVIDHFNPANAHQGATKYIQINTVVTTVDGCSKHQESHDAADGILRTPALSDQIVFRMSCQDNEFYVESSVSKAKGKVHDPLMPRLQYVNVIVIVNVIE